LLPLLPSGPGGVHKLSSRGDRRGHHKTGVFDVSGFASRLAATEFEAETRFLQQT